MKKSVKYLILLVLINSKFYSQKLGDEIVIEIQKPQKIQFEIFAPNEQVMYKVDKQVEVNKKTPEGLVQSYFSATNQ